MQISGKDRLARVSDSLKKSGYIKNIEKNPDLSWELYPLISRITTIKHSRFHHARITKCLTAKQIITANLKRKKFSPGPVFWLAQLIECQYIELEA